jgi:hypothetical protein
MAPRIPTVEPSTLVAGSTWQWTRDFAAFPAAEGWALAYHLVGPAHRTTILATNTGTAYVVAVAATETAELPAGEYAWRALATKAGAVHPVASGRIRVLPNPATMAPGEQLTHQERMLAAVDAVLAGRVTDDVEAFTIHGRSLTHIPFKELRAYRVVLADAVRRQRGGSFTTPIEVVHAAAR